MKAYVKPELYVERFELAQCDGVHGEGWDDVWRRADRRLVCAERRLHCAHRGRRGVLLHESEQHLWPVHLLTGRSRRCTRIATA